jgi:hypothetical protein
MLLSNYYLMQILMVTFLTVTDLTLTEADLHDEEHPCKSLQRMCKWGKLMNQTGKNVQDYNIDEHSDSYKTAPT